MTNEIIEAIAQKLGEIFSPDEWHFYLQDTVQKLEDPCFIIELIGSTQQERLGSYRVQLLESFSVSVICPGNIRKLRETVEMAALQLRFIDLPDGKPIFARNRNVQILDAETANITFSIARTVWMKPDEDPRQERLVHTIGVKHELQGNGD